MKTVTKIFLVVLMLLPAFAYVSAQPAFEFPEPCSIAGPKYGTDSVEGVKNFSLYRENYKQWKACKYKCDAIDYTIGPWRYCFLNTPLASQNIYFDGINIIEYLMNKAEDSLSKERYIDTLMMLYDQNIAAFGCSKQYGEGYVLGRKGYDLYQYRPNEKEKIYHTLDKSIRLMGKESEAAVMSIYYKTTDELVRDGKLDTALIYENYDKVVAIIDAQIADYKKELVANPADSAKINRKMELFIVAEGNVNSIFDPWANCEQIVKIYSAKFEANKSNADWLRKLVILMDKKNCTDDPLYFSAAEELYKLEPTPASALTLGVSFLRVKKFNDAVKYLNEAVKGLEDPMDKAAAYLNLADAYRNLGQYANARSAALNSAQLNPTDGMPYILIGDLYMATASSCGDNAVTQRAGYWAAADKYAKAKSVSTDERVINAANQKLGSAAGGFPKTEDLFFYNIVKGSSYTISCWYTESTIVRSID
ncbi:MAG: hypothetical protein CVU11_02040 [Bacteroidetes bacterium HGW-Bacteroidetes-6]|jgi:tetratricopeptide (TPR) repeat protein|nr:MAG: hypothetical protein CVU11_02040 [Bacteroidetes bacterium HGW-Bacteroidetes-6]